MQEMRNRCHCSVLGIGTKESLQAESPNYLVDQPHEIKEILIK